MRLAIIGSRDFADYPLLCRTISSHWPDSYGHGERFPGVSEVVSGGAKGADTLGARWATENHVKLTVFKPDWEKHGKAAGFIRNEDIVAASDFVLAFWDGVSKGTANSLAIAKRLKKPTLIVYF